MAKFLGGHAVDLGLVLELPFSLFYQKNTIEVTSHNPRRLIRSSRILTADLFSIPHILKSDGYPYLTIVRLTPQHPKTSPTSIIIPTCQNTS